MKRESFDLLLNVIRNRLTRQNTVLRNCLTPEKVLACGLLRLAHGNSYETIGPALNVGRTTAIEACQDVVEALYELRNEYIKFPTTVAETMRCIETFTDKSRLPNIVGAIDGMVRDSSLTLQRVIREVSTMLGYIETARFIKEQATKIYSRNPLKESASQIFILTW